MFQLKCVRHAEFAQNGFVLFFFESFSMLFLSLSSLQPDYVVSHSCKIVFFITKNTIYGDRHTNIYKKMINLDAVSCLPPKREYVWAHHDTDYYNYYYVKRYNKNVAWNNFFYTELLGSSPIVKLLSFVFYWLNLNSLSTDSVLDYQNRFSPFSVSMLTSCKFDLLNKNRL